jgi:phospholipid/cholesterol/gamma-HCH transport system ATP-binding protein
MIEVRDLYHSFGDKEVLKGISFSIEQGQCVAVMGASGGGKTTLLRILAGLLRATQGEVRVLDVDLAKASDDELDGVRRQMGIVFQSGALFDYLNVFENIVFALRRRGRHSASELKERVAQCLAMVGLDGTESLMPSELSGGMRKRVAVARALATEPALLFYDEPTSGLDPVTAYSMDALIREVNRKTGATSIVVSHDLHSVLRVADRVLFLYDGRILADQPPLEFRENADSRIQEIVQKAEAERLAETGG